MTIAEVATLIMSFGAFIGVILTVREVFWKSRQLEASTTDQFEKILSRTIKNYNKELALNKEYRKKIDQLEEELEELKAIVEDWDKGIKALVQQLEDNTIIPAWLPEKQYKRKSIEV